MSLILVTETSYLLAIMIYYCRENFIRASYLAIIKISQSTLLIIIFSCLLIITLEQEKYNYDVSENG